MSTTVVDLNDAGFTLWSEEGVARTFPVCALIEPGSVTLGDAALRRARQEPRNIHTRFWDALSVDAMGANSGPVHRTADIAFRHLGSVWKTAGKHTELAIFAVPGHYDQQQLGLLLGLARQLEIPRAALVDAAVLAGRPAADRVPLYVDIGLHRTTVTQLECGAHMSRQRVHTLPDFGTRSLEDSWVKRIADNFVRGTRFDPLHSAATEQQLYDRLPEWLQQLREQDEIDVEALAGEHLHTVAVTRTELMRAASAQYREILAAVRDLIPSGAPVTLSLNARVWRLPGMVDVFEEIPDCDIIRLDPDTVYHKAIQHRNAIWSVSAQPGVIRSLPVAAELAPAPTVSRAPVVAATPESGTSGVGNTPSNVAPPPSHLLLGACAFAMSDRPFVIGSRAADGAWGYMVTGSYKGVSRRHCSVCFQAGRLVLDDHSTYGTFVNDNRVNSSVGLQPGDRIRVGSPGLEFTVIAQVSEHGA